MVQKTEAQSEMDTNSQPVTAMRTDDSTKLNGDVTTQMHNAASAVADHHDVTVTSVDGGITQPPAPVKGGFVTASQRFVLGV